MNEKEKEKETKRICKSCKKKLPEGTGAYTSSDEEGNLEYECEDCHDGKYHNKKK